VLIFKCAMSIQIDPSREVRIFFAILNSVVCMLLLIIRLHHWKGRTEVLKISLTGSSCILAALVCCLTVLNTGADWIFGNLRFCDLSLRLVLSTYALHRALLYLFIILRLEVINRSQVMNPRIISLGKIVIGIIGISMVVVTALAVHGISDNFRNCTTIMQTEIIVPFFALDGLICAGGTWMFISPLRKILRNMERVSVRRTLKTTMTWSIVSLIGTLISMLTIAVTDGLGGVVACDCSITSFSLVMMMAPVRHKVLSNVDSTSKKAAVLQAEMMGSGANKV